MIKIQIKDYNSLSEWYAGKMRECIKNKKVKDSSEGLSSAQKKILGGKNVKKLLQEKDVIKFLGYIDPDYINLNHDQDGTSHRKINDGTKMSDTEIEQLLTVPVYEMETRAPELYSKIKPYYTFCCWYAELDQTFEEGKWDIEAWKDILLKENDSEKLIPEWKAIFENCWDLNIETSDPAEYIHHLKEAVDALNIKVGEKIQYKYMSTHIRREIAYRMDVKVCPYCNQAFVYSLSYKDYKDQKHLETYLGDMDHLLPKSIFGLFSLSLWNLVPCCKSCNQLFKKSEKKELLNPLVEGFEEDCHLEVIWDENLTVDMLTGMSENEHMIDVKWNIDTNSATLSENRRKQIQNSIDTFKLNRLYNAHKDIIRDTLRRKTIYQGAYLEEVQELADQIGLQYLGTDEYNRLFYGASLNPKMDQYEIHGKMIRDLVQSGKANRELFVANGRKSNKSDL